MVLQPHRFCYTEWNGSKQWTQSATSHDEQTVLLLFSFARVEQCAHRLYLLIFFGICAPTLESLTEFIIVFLPAGSFLFLPYDLPGANPLRSLEENVEIRPFTSFDLNFRWESALMLLFLHSCEYIIKLFTIADSKK